MGTVAQAVVMERTVALRMPLIGWRSVSPQRLKSGSVKTGAAAGAAAAGARSRSAAEMRPRMPLPCTSLRSIPRSRASLRTLGAAGMCRPLPVPETGAAGAAGVAAGSSAGAGSAAGASSAGSGAAAVSSSALSGAASVSAVSATVRMTSPTFSSAPFSTLMPVTVPATSDGTSMTALSVSSSMTAWSTSIRSPSATRIETTVPLSIPSPTSGNLNCLATSTVSLADPRVRFFRVDAQVRDGPAHERLLHGSRLRQRVERGHSYVPCIDFKEVTEFLPAFGTAETVRAEHRQRAGHEAAQGLRQQLDVVGSSHDRAFTVVQHAVHVGDARFRFRMQPVPAFRVERVDVQLLVGSGAPDVSGNTVFLQEFLRFEHLEHDGARTEQLNAGPFPVRGAEQVQAAQDAVSEFFTAQMFRGRRLGMVFVADRQVVENVFLLEVHAAHAVVHDCHKFVAEARVESEQVRHGVGKHVGVAVLVLQAFTVQGGAAGGRAEQEAAGHRISCRPDEVADPLEAEHRVVRVKRNGVHAVVGVGGAGSDERGSCSGFRDAFLEDLPVGGFLVVEEVFPVDGFVQLTRVRVDADLPEQGFHAEGARLVGNYRHDELAPAVVPQELAEERHVNHRGGHFPFAGTGVKLLEHVRFGRFDRFGFHDAARQYPAERLAAFHQVPVLV